MSGDNRRKRRRTMELWHDNPRCYWCERLLVLVFRPFGISMSQFPRIENEATIDHLNSRYGERRQVNGEEVTVISCPKCNNQRQQVEAALLGIEEMRRRSGKYPQETEQQNDM